MGRGQKTSNGVVDEGKGREEGGKTSEGVQHLAACQGRFLTTAERGTSSREGCAAASAAEERVRLSCLDMGDMWSCICMTLKH